MVSKKVEICGKQIVNKHTYYEVLPVVDGKQATVIITNDVAALFERKYGVSLRRTGFVVDIDFTRNDERVRACQLLYRSNEHLVGSLSSLEGVMVNGTK